MRVPPNISAATYGKALTELAQVVGKEWVFTSDEDLDLYRDAYSPYLNEPEERIASGAVAPSSTPFRPAKISAMAARLPHTPAASYSTSSG
jgi:(+)-pinoresinol hydroxylase